MDLEPAVINLLFKFRHAAILLIAFFAVFALAIIIAILLYTEEKSWFEMSWELVTGGSLGAVAGLLFYLLIGGIGFVAGPLVYGSLGLLSLIIGGALTGLGLGSIANVLRNPDRYNYNNPEFSLVLMFGAVVGLALVYFLHKRGLWHLPTQTSK